MPKTYLYFSWCQNEHGIPLGLLTEGSIEVCNKDVKHANRYSKRYPFLGQWIGINFQVFCGKNFF